MYLGFDRKVSVPDSPSSIRDILETVSSGLPSIFPPSIVANSNHYTKI